MTDPISIKDSDSRLNLITYSTTVGLIQNQGGPKQYITQDFSYKRFKTNGHSTYKTQRRISRT